MKRKKRLSIKGLEEDRFFRYKKTNSTDRKELLNFLFRVLSSLKLDSAGLFELNEHFLVMNTNERIEIGGEVHYVADVMKKNSAPKDLPLVFTKDKIHFRQETGLISSPHVVDVKLKVFNGVKPPLARPFIKNHEGVEFLPNYTKTIDKLMLRACEKHLPGSNLHRGRINNLRDDDRYPQPTDADQQVNDLIRHYAHAFHTENYMKESIDGNIEKMLRVRPDNSKLDMEELMSAIGVVFNQLGYFRNNMPQWRKNRTHNYYDFCKKVFQEKIKLDKGAGVLAPQDLSQIKEKETITLKTNIGEYRYTFGKIDGQAVLVNGPKAHFLLHTLAYLEYLLQMDPDKLNPEWMYLNIPQIYDAVEKAESRKGTEDKSKCRLIFCAPFLTMLIEFSLFEPYGRLQKHNLPFFHGFDWSHGAAQQIFSHFNFVNDLFFKKVGIPRSLGDVDLFCGDVHGMDQSYTGCIIHYISNQIYTAFYKSGYEEKLNINDIKEADKHDFVRLVAEVMISETEDSFSMRFQKLLEFAIHCDSFPIVTFSSAMRVFQFLRVLCSGLKITGTSNSNVSASAVVLSLRRAYKNIPIDHPHKPLFAEYLKIVHDHPNCIVMGDNIMAHLPRMFRRWYMLNVNKFTVDPMNNSMLNKVLVDMGFGLKKEETAFIPSFVANYEREPPVIVDGWAAAPFFCQRHFMIRRATKETSYIALGAISKDQVMIPYRRLSDWFSKISPQACNKTLLVYYLKLSSLIHDNASANTKAHQILQTMRDSLTPVVQKVYDKRPDALLGELMENPDNVTKMAHHFGLWDYYDRESVIERTRRFTYKELNENLNLMNKKFVRRNFLRRIDYVEIFPKQKDIIKLRPTYFLFMQDLAKRTGNASVLDFERSFSLEDF